MMGEGAAGQDRGRREDSCLDMCLVVGSGVVSCLPFHLSLSSLLSSLLSFALSALACSS